MADELTSIPKKPSMESIVVGQNMIKATLDSLYQDLIKFITVHSNDVNVINELRDRLDDLGKISASVSKSTSDRNEMLVKMITDAVTSIKNNKDEISKDVVEKLDLDAKMNSLEEKLSQITAVSKGLKESSDSINDASNQLTLSISQLNMSVSTLNQSLSSLGLPTNYVSEANAVIDYLISRRKGPPVSYGELVLKFNPNVVKKVLLNAHKAGYIEWR